MTFSGHDDSTINIDLGLLLSLLQPRPLNPLSRVIRKQRGSAQGCAVSGLENKNLTFTHRNSRQTAILGPILTGLRDLGQKFSA